VSHRTGGHVRILVTSTPGTGHLYPLVPLALELQAAGHELRWATAGESCPQIERIGFRAAAAGLGLAERAHLVRERHLDLDRLPPRERRQAVVPVMFGEIAAPPMLADLEEIVERFRPNLVVHDLTEFAAAPIAASRGIPHVTLAFGLAVPGALLSSLAASVADIWDGIGLIPSESAGLYDHLYLSPVPESLGGPLPSRTARPLRPMHFDGASLTGPPPWISEFGCNRPGVYVTFGTQVADQAPWPEILAALGTVDVDAIATIGSGIEPSTLGPIPANVRVEPFVPQSFVLDRASLVVSHGGSGTLFAVAARGLPQLCVPIAADQWDNSDALAAAGSGLTLEPLDRVTSTISSALARLLGDPTFTNAAHRIAKDFVELPHPRELVEAVVSLA